MPEDLTDSVTGSTELVFPDDAVGQYRLRERSVYDAEEVRTELGGDVPQYGSWLPVEETETGMDAWLTAPSQLRTELVNAEVRSQELFEIVTMENVIEIRNHQVYSRFIDTLFKQGYDISINKVDCTDYGVPQNRKRLVVLASQIGDISLIDPTHTTYKDRPTVRKTIGGDTLKPIEAGGADDEDALHRSQALSEKNLERIRQSEPGGTWRDWDDELILDCHRKDSGSTYDAVYGRMEWDSAAPTITTQFYGYGSGRFGHPERDRAISLREGAMLQTFPKEYSFLKGDQDEIHYNQIGRFIGNAVPVRLAEIVGESINQHLNHHDVKDRNASRNRTGDEVRDVAQPQRVESPGAESIQ
jgi:DNA (cytosine-5)-methyltransferase 1